MHEHRRRIDDEWQPSVRRAWLVIAITAALCVGLGVLADSRGAADMALATQWQWAAPEQQECVERGGR